MRDLIKTKIDFSKLIEKTKEKENFKNNNKSFFFRTFDFQYFSKNPTFYTYNIKIEKINKLFFNFLSFSVLTLSIFTVIILTSIIFKIFEIKNNLIASGMTGINHLEKAQESILSSDIEKAQHNFKIAYKNFEEADRQLKKSGSLNASISIIPIASQYQQNIDNLIKIGKSTSVLGMDITEIIKQNENLKEQKNIQLINKINEKIPEIKKELSIIENSIIKIDTKYFDKNMAGKLDKIKTSLPLFKKYLLLGENILQEFPKILGSTEEQNYLLILQNNNEMRSTGGFIGSFGIIKIDKGEIKDFFIDDIYKLDNFYAKAVIEGKTPYIPPPAPMDPESTGTWCLRDANLNPDFTESAEKIIEFYEKEVLYVEEQKYPKKIDGVISLTPTVIEGIIKILGPIDVEEYGFTLTDKNILETLQVEVEAGKDKHSNKNPKIILELLKEKIINKFENIKNEKVKDITNIVLKNLDEKHILLYSKNYNFQDITNQLGWAGKINRTKGDFLMVINNNFGGGKSSLKVDEQIEQEINISQNGTITKTLNITREHTSDYFFNYYDPWEKKDKWLIGINYNYIKVYVPKGSKLIKAEGFKDKIDIYNETDKTVYGSDFTISPKEKRTVKLMYELPFKIEKENIQPYSLIMQKQPGSLGSKIKTIINTPDFIKINTANTNLIKEKDFYLGNLNIDRYLYLIYENLTTSKK